MNHPLVGNYFTKDDEMLMDYLQTFDVTFVGDDGSFRMEMVVWDSGRASIHFRPCLQRCLLCALSI